MIQYSQQSEVMKKSPSLLNKNNAYNAKISFQASPERSGGKRKERGKHEKRT
jgi:hypothetical protein